MCVISKYAASPPLQTFCHTASDHTTVTQGFGPRGNSGAYLLLHFQSSPKKHTLRCTREIHMDRHPPIFPDLSRGFDICFSTMSFEGCRPRWRVTRRAVKHPWGKECANIYIRPPLHKVGTEMLDIHLCIIGMYKTRSKRVFRWPSG